jgi:hypothetical protein
MEFQAALDKIAARKPGYPLSRGWSQEELEADERRPNRRPTHNLKRCPILPSRFNMILMNLRTRWIRSDRAVGGCISRRTPSNTVVGCWMRKRAAGASLDKIEDTGSSGKVDDTRSSDKADDTGISRRGKVGGNWYSLSLVCAEIFYESGSE